MLKQRIFTAIVLLAVLLPAAFSAHHEAFVFVTIALVSAAGWEWARMNGRRQVTSMCFGMAIGLTCLIAWQLGALEKSLTVLWVFVGAVWVLGGVLLLGGGVVMWQRLSTGLRLFFGWAALAAAWIALTQAKIQGIHFLFSVMALVWAADIFAYAFGRTWGNRWFKAKLAPSISPGKTWEGAFGGLLGVVVLAFVSIGADAMSLTDSIGLYTHLLERGWLFLGIALLFLTGMSVVGDLLESLFKRNAGVKDSSGLLPGHGGVLDRIDALLPVMPLAMMLVSI